MGLSQVDSKSVLCSEAVCEIADSMSESVESDQCQGSESLSPDSDQIRITFMGPSGWLGRLGGSG